MARGNYREYLKGPEVWVKKYFYILRPLLAMNWLEQDLGLVPTDFNVLVAQLVTEPELRQAIDQLVIAKRAGAELDRGPRIEPISQYIERELERWERQVLERSDRRPADDGLDDFFRASFAEVWGPAGQPAGAKVIRTSNPG